MEIKHSPSDYDTIAERYAAEIDVRPWNALYERPTTMSLLPDVTGRDVLDAGCGAGWYSEQLAGRGARVIAIDRSARMVAITKKRLAGRMRVIEADVTDLREVFADMSFDVVLCSLVLHYITDLTAAFSECARVLRREGRLVFSTHHPFDAEGFDAKPRGRDGYLHAEIIEEEWEWLGTMRYWRRPLRDVTEPLNHAGFLIERVCEPDPGEALRIADPKVYARLERVPAFLFVRARKMGGACYVIPQGLP
jgi:SAM-dependent methyltransferase